MFRKLMPFVVVACVLNFVACTNIALAMTDLAVDLGISSAAYGFASSFELMAGKLLGQLAVGLIIVVWCSSSSRTWRSAR
jgi:hypothetical protein